MTKSNALVLGVDLGGTNLEAFDTPSDLSLADTNGDGWLDVVASFSGRRDQNAGAGGTVALLFGTGVPGAPFVAQAHAIAIDGGDRDVASIATAVVNADRDPDRELVIGTLATLLLVEVGSTGTLALPQHFARRHTLVGDTLTLRTADVNGDRLPELLVGTDVGLWIYAAEEGTLGEEETIP